MSEENYRVEAVPEKDDDIGMIDISVYPAADEKAEPLGVIVIQDPRNKDKGSGKSVDHFSITVTYMEYKDVKDGVNLHELFETVFAYLKAHGVEDVQYCTPKKDEEPFLLEQGFEFKMTNMSSYFPIHHYGRDL